jgi:hypothetical protein
VKYPERWRENWRMIAPAGAVRMEVPRQPKDRAALRRELGALSRGTPVVLVAAGPGGRRRCRAAAETADIDVENEYMAFPSALAPAYLVQDAPSAWRYFVRTALVTPPRIRLPRLVGSVLVLGRTLAPWWVARRVAPGRVLVGRRA